MYKNKTIYEVIEYDEEEIGNEMEVLKIQIQNEKKYKNNMILKSQIMFWKK